MCGNFIFLCLLGQIENKSNEQLENILTDMQKTSESKSTNESKKYETVLHDTFGVLTNAVSETSRVLESSTSGEYNQESMNNEKDFQQQESKHVIEKSYQPIYAKLQRELDEMKETQNISTQKQAPTNTTTNINVDLKSTYEPDPSEKNQIIMESKTVEENRTEHEKKEEKPSVKKTKEMKHQASGPDKNISPETEHRLLISIERTKPGTSRKWLNLVLILFANLLLWGCVFFVVVYHWPSISEYFFISSAY